MKCKTCDWWSKFSRNRGECCFNPPFVMLAPYSEEVMTIRPKTHSEEFCSNYKSSIKED